MSGQDNTRPGPPVPACDTGVRGRVGFVVTELGSLWRELRAPRRASGPTGGEQ